MFKYKIIDEFLNPEDFKILSNLNLKNISEDEIMIYHNKITKGGVISSGCMEKDLVQNLFNNYHHKALELLKELYPEKVSLWDYSEFHITQTGSMYRYPMHRDSPTKLLSGVIYLAPINNKGTLLYKNKYDNDAKEIVWKQNRALFFSRNENNSYHSFEGNNQSTRLTLIYNLMTYDLKSVCKIEKINYQKVKVREFINPYLYRFFKKIF